MEELFEKVLFYIFIAFIVGLFIDLVIKLIGKVGKSNSITNQSTYTAKKENYRLLDVYDHFSSVLSNTFCFVDAYLQECPGEWIFMTISPVYEKSTFSTELSRYYDEYIEFQVTVGTWYDGLLFKHKGIYDYIRSVYKYESSGNRFICKIKMAESEGCVIPFDVVRKRLFDYFDLYERNNPNRKLTRLTNSVSNRWNMSNN